MALRRHRIHSLFGSGNNTVCLRYGRNDLTVSANTGIIETIDSILDSLTGHKLRLVVSSAVIGRHLVGHLAGRDRNRIERRSNVAVIILLQSGQSFACATASSGRIVVGIYRILRKLKFTLSNLPTMNFSTIQSCLVINQFDAVCDSNLLMRTFRHTVIDDSRSGLTAYVGDSGNNNSVAIVQVHGRPAVDFGRRLHTLIIRTS